MNHGQSLVLPAFPSNVGVLRRASSSGPSLPAGALAIWDASNYVASPRATVKNSVTNGATDANLLAAPRRMFDKYNNTIFFWGIYGGPVVTDYATAAPDGGVEASSIVGSGVTNWGLAYNTVVLPAGTYTVACSIRSLGAGSAVQLAIAGSQNLDSGDLTVTSSWARKTFTFTQPSAGNIDFRLTAPAAGSNPNLAICDYQVFVGSSDLNTTWASLPPLSVRNGDAVLGNSQFAGNTALVNGMVSDAILSHVQLPTAETPSDFTVLYCTKPTASGAGVGNTGILSVTGNDWYRFVSGYNANGGGGGEGPQLFGNGTPIGCNANGNPTSGSSWGLFCQGVITGVSRKNGTRTSTFINGLKVQDGIPYIPSAFTMRNLTLGGIRTVNADLPSGHSWGCIVYYNRALTDVEVAQANAYFKAKYGDVGLKRLLGIDGTSITQILPTYQSYVGPNLNPQRLVTSQAVASATVALANAGHVGPLDATITAGPPQDSYVLINELGTNDLAAGRTPSQLISDLQAYITARRAAGWQKFVLFTVLPRNPSGTSLSEAAFNSARASFNSSLRAAVGTWFDALVDQAANSTIGVDGAWSNGTNFPDNTHPSASVHQNIIEPLVRVAVNGLEQVTTGAPTMTLISASTDSTPDFTVAFPDLVPAGSTVIMQYDTSSSFTSPTNISHVVTANESLSNESFLSSGPLANGSYFFRIKVRVEGVDGAWSNTVPATVAAAPVISSATSAPVVGTSGGTAAATLGVTTNGSNGTLYWTMTESQTTPSPTQIKTGKDSAGAPASASGSKAVTAAGAQVVNATGLPMGMTLFTHFMHENTIPLQSNAVSTSTPITLDTSNPVLTFAPNVANNFATNNPGVSGPVWEYANMAIGPAFANRRLIFVLVGTGGNFPHIVTATVDFGSGPVSVTDPITYINEPGSPNGQTISVFTILAPSGATSATPAVTLSDNCYATPALQAWSVDNTRISSLVPTITEFESSASTSISGTITPSNGSVVIGTTVWTNGGGKGEITVSGATLDVSSNSCAFLHYNGTSGSKTITVNWDASAHHDTTFSLIAFH